MVASFALPYRCEPCKREFSVPFETAIGPLPARETSPCPVAATLTHAAAKR